MDTDATKPLTEADPSSRGKAPLRVAVAEADFAFRSVTLDGAGTSVQGLLQIAGFAPPEEYLVFRVTADGDLKECRLREPVTPVVDETERFVVFKSDRSFRVVIDGRRFEWGSSDLTGLIAKQLVGADPENTKIWQETGNGADLPIEDSDIIKLAEKGVERLRTSEVFPLCIEGARFQWPSPTITTEEIAKLGGWEPSEGVQWVDLATNEVRTLKAGETVDLRSVSNFVKKIGFRRG